MEQITNIPTTQPILQQPVLPIEKKYKPRLVDLIANPDGTLSSKRAAGWITLFFTFFLIYKGGIDFDILFLLIGFVFGAFGLTTSENIAYFNNLGKKSNPISNKSPDESLYNSSYPSYNPSYNSPYTPPMYSPSTYPITYPSTNPQFTNLPPNQPSNPNIPV